MGLMVTLVGGEDSSRDPALGWVAMGDALPLLLPPASQMRCRLTVLLPSKATSFSAVRLHPPGCFKGEASPAEGMPGLVLRV